MRSLLIRTLSSIVMLAVCVTATQACINDRDAVRSERDFKSQYFKSQYKYQNESENPRYESPEPTNNPLVSWLSMGVGTALLIGAVAISLHRPY